MQIDETTFPLCAPTSLCIHCTALRRGLAYANVFIEHDGSDTPGNSLSDLGSTLRLKFRSRDTDDELASAEFSCPTPGGNGLMPSPPFCQNVRVGASHRSEGLADAMYVAAERIFGQPLVNYWDGDPTQTDAARGFWARPDRPFGGRVCGGPTTRSS